MKKTRKIGLTLSGGAVRGYAHIPIIQKIQKENIKIDMISGSSAGALIGAYFALHGEIDSLLKTLKKFKLHHWLNFSFNKDKKIKLLLENFFGDANFTDTKIKLFINVTNVKDVKPLIIDSGKIADAVYASLSMPGIIQNRELEGVLVSDGDLSNYLPYKILFENGADHIIAIDLYNKLEEDINLLKNSPTALLQYLWYKIMLKNNSNIEKEAEKNIFIFKPISSVSLGAKEWLFRFDLIDKYMKPGTDILKKEWKNLQTWLAKQSD